MRNSNKAVILVSKFQNVLENDFYFYRSTEWDKFLVKILTGHPVLKRSLLIQLLLAAAKIEKVKKMQPGFKDRPYNRLNEKIQFKPGQEDFINYFWSN